MDGSEDGSPAGEANWTGLQKTDVPNYYPVGAPLLDVTTGKVVYLKTAVYFLTVNIVGYSNYLNWRG